MANAAPPMTATEIAEAIRAQRLLAADAVDVCLRRIAAENFRLNAIVTLDEQEARKQAGRADSAVRRGTSLGPLHGVPITITDAFDTAGVRTTSGYPPFASRVPGTDASAVARLRQAGAIVLGKTNLPPLANGIQTDNLVFGRTNNPWDVTRTPGGSGGAAAAASGMSALELGSDISGSLRISAHFCGIYALKPTAGRTPISGHIASARPPIVPQGGEWLLTLMHAGPMARSVADLRCAYDVLAGPEQLELDPSGDWPAKTPRIAWTFPFGGAPLDAVSRSVLAAAVESLVGQGLTIQQNSPSGFDFVQAWEIAGECLGALNTALQSPAVQLGRRAAALLLSLRAKTPLMRGLFRGVGLTRGGLAPLRQRKEALISALEQFFATVDVWMVPVFPTAAFTHRPPNEPLDVDGRPAPMLEASLLHTLIFNVTGHPVVVIPAGFTADGLPIGVQLIGKRWGDRALLAAAAVIDSALGAYRLPIAA